VLKGTEKDSETEPGSCILTPSRASDRVSDPDRYGKGQRNGAWLGKPMAGLRLLFKDNDPAWDSPIEMPDEPPVGWANCKTSGHCMGNVSVVGRNGTVTLESFTGQSTIE
jgi:hypothetical protein